MIRPIASSFALTVIFAGSAFAALAPEYQNARDLDVIVNYIKSNPSVIESLQSIDFEHFVVRYGENCAAHFDRQFVPRLPGWAGPAPPLELGFTRCVE